MIVGIGCKYETLSDLRTGYLQAKHAIEIAHIFSPKETTCVYERLLLQRLLAELPPETASHYHSQLFNRSTARLFNDEMLYTIDAFFRKDLNLSNAARHLFIHRNTLVYRLDKVQKQTGLDLRRFDDAVTFRILYELGKCGTNDLKK